MSQIISQKYTLDINFSTVDPLGGNGSYTWKFNDPQGSVSTVTQIRQSFGFDSNGDPSTGTGLFGSLYQDGLRLFTKSGAELKTIDGARKIQVITTREDLPI